MNRKQAGIIAAVGIAAALPLFLAAPSRPGRKKKAPFEHKNFAHRGLHSKDGSVPENSLAAFRRAAEAGYGVELDVQLSKDGEVVVFHDDTLERVCGVRSGVDEKTFAELRALRLNDTDETIPLFTEVLDVYDGRGPMIVELKSGRRNRELCEKTLAILKSYSGNYCVESFDPAIVAWFRFHAPKILRGQLAMPWKQYAASVPKWLAFAGSRCLCNFMGRPQFIAYDIGRLPLMVRLCHRLGAMNVRWTSHDIRNEKNADAVIFEFYRPGRSFSNV